MLARMDCHGLTDPGRVRPNNQDHFLIADLNKSMKIQDTSLRLDNHARVYGGSQGKLLIVADGMGGEAEGERACIIAVDQVTTYVLNSLSWYFRLEEDSELDFEDHLKQALESCQKSIQSVVAIHPEMKSMGTTMTMVYIVWPRAFVVHVGDSRCYLMRKSVLEQITVDHTFSEVLAASGQISRDEAQRSPMRHALWNVLGGKSDELSVDVYKLTLDADDLLLLCTDGLYDMVPADKLEELLKSSMNAATTCRKLIDLANENGGKDNITVIVSRFLAPGHEDSRAFVEAEVPLNELTAANENTAKTAIPAAPGSVDNAANR